MSHSSVPARADHLALANNAAFRYHELVLPPRELTGFEHLAAAGLAADVAAHLDTYAVEVDDDLARAIQHAAETARAAATVHDKAAWTSADVVDALTDLLPGGVIR